jgi:serine/threonine protein kinase/tetratricopeptide (TPR) repeat protein
MLNLVAEETLLAAMRQGYESQAAPRAIIPVVPDDRLGQLIQIVRELPVSAASSGWIGEYEILREIARGGMGIVYQARHRTLGRIAAVKLIKSGELADAEEIQRFRAEAQAASQLDHPAIVPIYEVGQSGQQYYMAMGLVDGDSLWDRVKESPFKPDEAARILQLVAEAVQYAHERGIIHRDLKPHNVLLSKQGQPKVTDFGLAKRQDGDSSLTATGQILGTPSYMSPEQTKGLPDQIGPATDVYSLGATLYCLLVGRPPFQAATPLETMRQVVEQEPVPPRYLNPAIPRDLETICLKCLQKRPDQRYATCNALASDLARHLRGEPIQARRTGPLGRGLRWCRRNPVGAALAGSFVLLISLASLTFWLLHQQQQFQAVSHIVDSIEKLLDHPTADPAFVDQGDALLTALRVVAPERVSADELRIRQAFGKAIESGILQPKLGDDDAKQLEQSLKRLAQVDSSEAERLQKLLADRRQGWQTLAELASPYSNLNQIFVDQNVEMKEGQPFHGAQKGNLSAAPDVVVPTQITTLGKMRLEAVFGPEWEGASQIGIEFQYETGESYRFSLSALRTDRDDTDAIPTVIRDFANARRSGGQIKIEISRNQVALRSRILPASTLDGGLLRLDAQRLEDKLDFRVGSLPVLVFEDIFPIHSREPARFALIWPGNVGLERIHASTMPIAQTTNPLQEGDGLFSRGDYDAALSRFREASSTMSDAELRREAMYKYGICLVELQRLDDATEVFESLADIDGERWSMLAMIQMWLIHVQLRHREEADAIVHRIALRYTFDELARLVPARSRSKLVSLYGLEANPRLIRFLTYDPQRISRLERYVQLLDLIDDDFGRRLDARCQLIDAQWAAGNADLSHQLIMDAQHHVEAAFGGDTFHPALWNLYQASMFKRGLAQPVLTKLDEELKSTRPNRRFQRDPTGWYWRAQCLSKLGLFDEALKSIDQVDHSVSDDDHIRALWLLTSNVLRGLLYEKQGNRSAALAAWRAGSDLEPRIKTGRMTWLQYLLLRGLSGDFDRQDAEVMLSRFANAQGGSLESAIRSVLTADDLVPIVRGMFQTDHGREIVWQIATGELFPSEEAGSMISLFTYELLRQRAFEGEFSPEQHELIWPLCRSEVNAIARQGKYSVLQVGQAGMAWKGKLNFLGWGGLAPQLTPEMRGPAAYVFAHRMLRRMQISDARTLFKSALNEAVPDSVLSQLAQQDVSLLDDGRGLAIFRNPGSSPVEVQIRSENQTPQSVIVHRKSELPLPVGRYTWKAGEMNAGEFSISVCGRQIINLP